MIPSRQQARVLARGLGWFSLGLGVAELLFGRTLARAVGLRDADRLVRGYGLREIATGVGLLSGRAPATWLWARVAGDALDVATLARGLRAAPTGATVALGAVAGVTALDVACARRLSSEPAMPGVDYSARSGFPLPAAEMRGAALEDLASSGDLRQPALLRRRAQRRRPTDDAPS